MTVNCYVKTFNSKKTHIKYFKDFQRPITYR